MKHNIRIIIYLALIFILSQIIGIITIKEYYSYDESGNIRYEPLPLNIERPPVEEKNSVIYIVLGVLIGTALLLLLIKLKSKYISRIWFSIAVFIGLTIAFSVYTKMFLPLKISQAVAIILALIIAIWKVFFPNVYVNNFAEIFVYGGLAAIFHEMLPLFGAVLLLIIISIYDIIAVWKIKHMVTLAKYQTENKIFAGAMIPYSQNNRILSKIFHTKKSEKSGKKAKVKVKNAILGGGDMAFPLLFAGAVMKSFENGFLLSFIPIIFSTISLLLLFYFAKKDKFYPAMPFLSAGSFFGLGVIYLINFLLGLF